MTGGRETRLKLTEKLLNSYYQQFFNQSTLLLFTLLKLKSFFRRFMRTKIRLMFFQYREVIKTSTKLVHRCGSLTKVNKGKQRYTKINKGKQSQGLLKSMKSLRTWEKV